MKEEIQKFKVSGKVFIWKNKDNQRNYPGWNLTADKAACQTLISLLDLMDRCEWSTKKILTTEEPTQAQLKVPNNQNGQAGWKTTHQLTLNSRKNVSDDFWAVIENSGELEIQFGKDKLKQLTTAMTEFLIGKGDFAITDSKEENILYIW
ncbi:hypothetical protein ACD591_21165 [Rufibacter glacialis]|uniref:Uncharacterized protein n=1 Tax=Rufibacter glacialis TaxID=1259555 RepID=A0A5M8QV45_9BACT|nr:hypothetical protein [Rufibacter glacialis]KAA6438012.1 hypothetical protein FOE74_00835 [Rufibacter glacialis]GGK89638.1 hypothetical protein GCM10011405_41680 [Rufibacter glacialis]